MGHEIFETQWCAFYIEYKDEECRMDFEVYEIEQYDPKYFNKDESELYIRGHVKWDGCSNWDLVENHTVMYHACSREGIFIISEVMAKCWDIAKEKLERFDS